MRNYTIFLRSFAPWYEFGGVLPKSAADSTGGQFAGDNRGFSVDDDDDTTSRVNLKFSVDVAHGVLGFTKVWCDPSFGPYLMAGQRVQDRGKPKATVRSFKDGSDFCISVGYGAANPLAPGAPDIDAQGDYRLTYDSTKHELSVQAKISGDQFPACESFIDDGFGHGVFLGGFSPDNKFEILRLYGQFNQPESIYFESTITISVGPHGAFRSVRGAWGTQLGKSLLALGPDLSIHVWNASIMNAIPLPSDAPAAVNAP